MIYMTDQGESIWQCRERLIRDGIIPADTKIARWHSERIIENVIGYISVRRREQFALYRQQSEADRVQNH